MKRFALLLALTGALPACATWPEEGKGGFAERRRVADPVLESLADRFEAPAATGGGSLRRRPRG